LQPAGPIRAGSPARFFTLEALQRAWLAVKRAGGGAGVDAVTLTAFAARLVDELGRLREELAAGRYRPRPVRRVLVPKPNGGLRPLALWALRDRVAQRAVYDIIAPSFETTFLSCSYGYRPGLGAEDAVREVLAYRDRNLRWVVDGDIQECFDSIPTDRLMGLVARRVEDPLLKQYVGGWLEAQILNGVDGVPTKAGASQGSVLSPLLANIYLHEVDRQLVARKLALVRYADDLVICCQRKTDAEAALTATNEALGAWGLRLNEHKTHIVHFDQGFAWLGYFLLRDECFRL
jgi:group II intron reverse transcriptase/maturase